MDKEAFKQRVFEKYKNNLNNTTDDFYNNHFYIEKKSNLNYFKAISFNTILSTITIVGTVYAGIIAVNYFQQRTKTDFKNNINYDYSQDMNYEDKIYSKVINSYDEYKKSQNIWNNLVQMTASEFDSYFLLIIAVENTSLIGLDISDITSDADNLYIELYQSEKADDIEKNVISVKIPNEKLRKNIKFKIIGEKVNYSNYIPINEIQKNYSKDQAIKDNCFVVDNYNVISSDPNQLIDFVNNKNNNFIRIVDFEQETIITDIEFKDNKYYINRLSLENNSITYKIYKEVIIMRLKGQSYYSVFAQDEYNNQYGICIRINC